MPIRRLPSIHDGGRGSGSGSGRYSSSGSNCVGWMIGCSGTPVEDFCSVINQLFYHTRQGSFVVCPASEFLGKLAAHLRQHGNWRLTFSFDGEDVVLVDYQDYH